MTKSLRALLALSFLFLFSGAAFAAPDGDTQAAKAEVAVAAEVAPCAIEQVSSPLLKTVVDRGDQNRTQCVKACLDTLEQCRVECGGWDQGCWTACQLDFNQCKFLCEF